jgi:hypothetical protein
MDESLLPKLKRCTREVVSKASKPGGLLDKGEFTMSVARGLITKEMGLKEGELDGKEWKKVVKEEVTAALVRPKRGGAVRPNWTAGNEEGGGRDGRLTSRKNRNHRNPSLNRSRNPKWRLKRRPSPRRSSSPSQRRKQSLNPVSKTRKPIRR